MITFRLAKHSLSDAVAIVEVLHDGKVCCAIYPSLSGRGLRIISAHFDELLYDHGSKSRPAIPELIVTFDRQPYMQRS
jgi:hypothetical protein